MKGEVFIAAADISDEEDMKSVFEKTIAKYGAVDVVVNAAGHQNVDAAIGKVAPSQWWLDYVRLQTKSHPDETLIQNRSPDRLARRSTSKDFII
jgi:NAD(P)-dependent dehydrogenase (short-subunit alcohol dehydrogenase family)